MKTFVYILPFIFFGFSGLFIYFANTKSNQAIRFTSFIGGVACGMGLLLFL